VIRTLARRLPRPARDALRRGRHRYRSTRYRLRERVRPTPLGSADVARALRECGLEMADSCFVQAGMSGFGNFEDGPATVLAGIDEALGEKGLVTMPTFPLTRPAIEHFADDPIFDVRTTPSRMGAVSEAFRQLPDTRRSIHPSHSVAARGPGAEEIVAGHETATTPFGEGTPFPRIVERDALQVFFGTGTGVLTMYHWFEVTRRPPFPLDVFADRFFDVRCVGWEGEELLVRTLVHDPRYLPVRIDSNAHLQGVFRDAMLDAGGRSVTLGRGEIIAIRLQPMARLFEELLDQGVTIYHGAELPATAPSIPLEERVPGYA
jgi:aminoglycoside 3-N-acetyltransferase